MPKFVPSAVIDVLLDKVATATLMSVCNDASTPTDGNFAASTLASVAMSGSDFVKSAGTGTGRKVTVGSKINVDITGVTGNAQHIVLSLAGVILDVTTCETQVLTNGGTVTFPAWDHEISAPA